MGAEREELHELRREVRQLRQERELLSKGRSLKASLVQAQLTFSPISGPLRAGIFHPLRCPRTLDRPDQKPGQVPQAFEIWSNWFKNVGQLGFINIDLGRTQEPDLERRILRQVGSYGRQIGRMSEALEVLIEQADLDRTKLSDAQIAALHDFREMVEDVKNCKQYSRTRMMLR